MNNSKSHTQCDFAKLTEREHYKILIGTVISVL